MAYPGLTFDESYFRGGAYTDYGVEMWGTSFTFPGFVSGFRTRAQAKGTDPVGRRVGVLGCAYGYSVLEMRALGINAYGIDVSAFAISQAPVAVAPFLMQGDATVRNVLNSFRTFAGLTGNAKFDILLSEDLLPCLSDSEVTAASGEWRSRHGTRIAHRVSTHQVLNPVHNWHTLVEWRALIGSSADWLWRYTDWTEA